MRFASLGSGSEGNALVVSAGSTCLLMDCGFTLAETELRLARLGLKPEQLSGVVVTHEHGDHIAGVARLARRYALPVWLTHGTYLAYQSAFKGLTGLAEILPDQPFFIGDLQVHPYAVPHDAAEPVQYVFGDGAARLGVLTDTGCITPHIISTLEGCSGLVLECNHDSELLASGDYPYCLKQRVGGRYGHLNNEEAASLLARIDCSRLQHVVAAHISRKNNTPELAVSALAKVLGCEESWIAVASQDEGLDWRTLY